MRMTRVSLAAGVLLASTGCQSPLMMSGLFPFGTKNQPVPQAAPPQTASTPMSQPGMPGQPPFQPGLGQQTAQQLNQSGVIQQTSAQQAANQGAPGSVIPAGGTTDPQQRLKEFMQRGNRAQDERQYQLARIEYESALGIDPTNLTAHHMLGRVGDQLNDYEYAEYHYLQALSRAPQDPDLLTDYGYSLFQQGRLSDAKNYLQQAIAINPRHRMACVNMAAATFWSGDRDGAEAWLNKIASGRDVQDAMVMLAQKPPKKRLSQGGPLLSGSERQNPVAPNLSFEQVQQQMSLARENSIRDRENRDRAEKLAQQELQKRRLEYLNQAMNHGPADHELNGRMQQIEHEYREQRQQISRIPQSANEWGTGHQGPSIENWNPAAPLGQMAETQSSGEAAQYAGPNVNQNGGAAPLMVPGSNFSRNSEESRGAASFGGPASGDSGLAQYAGQSFDQYGRPMSYGQPPSNSPQAQAQWQPAPQLQPAGQWQQSGVMNPAPNDNRAEWSNAEWSQQAMPGADQRSAPASYPNQNQYQGQNLSPWGRPTPQGYGPPDTDSQLPPAMSQSVETSGIPQSAVPAEWFPSGSPIAQGNNPGAAQYGARNSRTGYEELPPPGMPAGMQAEQNPQQLRQSMQAGLASGPGTLFPAQQVPSQQPGMISRMSGTMVPATPQGGGYGLAQPGQNGFNQNGGDAPRAYSGQNGTFAEPQNYELHGYGNQNPPGMTSPAPTSSPANQGIWQPGQNAAASSAPTTQRHALLPRNSMPSQMQPMDPQTQQMGSGPIGSSADPRGRQLPPAATVPNGVSSQIPSPTWNHDSNQPVNSGANYSQASTLNPAWANGGALSTPTMQTGFVRPPYQQDVSQLPPNVLNQPRQYVPGPEQPGMTNRFEAAPTGMNPRGQGAAVIGPQ